MPRWTERTNAIRAAIEEEEERRALRRLLDQVDQLGAATHKDRVLVNPHAGRSFRPQWWRLPRVYGTPYMSYGIGLRATSKANRLLPKWRIRRRRVTHAM